GGIHVGGLSPDAAYAVVRAAFRSALVLTVGAHKEFVSPTELGAVAYAKAAVARARSAEPGTAIAVGVSVRGAAVRKVVDYLAQRFNHDPVDSKVLLRALRPFVTEGQPGKEVDRRGAVATIVQALRENQRTGIELPFDDVPQKVGRANFGPVIVI